MGSVVKTTSEEMLGAIRLAWWRERLEELDQGKVPPEPRLEAALAMIERYELTGAKLSNLSVGWQYLLEPFPWTDQVIDAVAAHGSLLFEYAAVIVGGDAAMAARAGSLWALMEVAKHCSDEGSRAALIARAHSTSEELSGVAAKEIRPLTMLALLARRDLEQWPRCEGEGTPARAWAIFRHRLTGHL